jgi:hypothetical protein
MRDEQYPWHQKKKKDYIVFVFDGCPSLSLMLENPLTTIRCFASSSEGCAGNIMIHSRQ